MILECCQNNMKKLLEFHENNYHFDKHNSNVPSYTLAVEKNNVLGIFQNNKIYHSEILAMDYILNNNKDPRNITLYCTMEPCPMCLFFLSSHKINMIVFGCYNILMGACGGSFYLLNLLPVMYKPQVIGGIMEGECLKIIQQYFKNRRRTSIKSIK